ncbi:GntR family transcriptional regulator [Occultella glacieicola]|uniref:GntR family transcriptional regulator n=1 Tax=Occultella glacieicola TaxID=2518684 RepID=A0ABY2DX41_9MICO|nr:GntR family transcriptional regulator [Occultella glacieicola]TDE88552.1 GntR family transcriptional regulator [Occultella glacieicola]
MAAKESGTPKVRKRTLSSVVTSQMRQRIVDGTFPPGSQLNEVELARRFATSRGPVREGMQRLVQEGLLVSEPHRGMFVPLLDESDIADLYYARAAVERAAMLRLVDQGVTAATVANLEQALGEMAAAIEREDWGAVATSDLRFHELIVDASGSPRLSRMYAALAGESRLAINILVGSYDGRTDYLEEHAKIFELLVAGNRSGLLGELSRHLQTGQDTATKNSRGAVADSAAAVRDTTT